MENISVFSLVIDQNFLLGSTPSFLSKHRTQQGNPLPSYSFPVPFSCTIGGTNNRNNTDDVGFIAPKMGVDSPIRVR